MAAPINGSFKHVTGEQLKDAVKNSKILAPNRLQALVAYQLKDYEEFWVSESISGYERDAQIILLRPIMQGITVKTKAAYENLLKNRIVVGIRKQADGSYISAYHEKLAPKPCKGEACKHSDCTKRIVEILVGDVFFSLPASVRSVTLTDTQYSTFSTSRLSKFVEKQPLAQSASSANVSPSAPPLRNAQPPAMIKPSAPVLQQTAVAH